MPSSSSVPFRITARLLGRAKGGQSAWSPNRGPTTSVGGSMPTVMTGSELTRITYRPLPRQYTVDYEEDYGNSVMIQREFVSPRAREATTNIHNLGHSTTELNDIRRQLAKNLNTERNDDARARSPRNAVQFTVNPTASAAAGAVSAPQFVFDSDRIKYVERFERHVGSGLRSLAEACAVLYGVDDEAGREGWYAQFLGLDAAQLEKEAEIAVAARAAAQDLEEDMSSSPSVDDDTDEGEGGANGEAGFSLPLEQAAFAPLYLNFKAYCDGRAPAAFPSTMRQYVANTGGPKHQWRDLMHRLVHERYETLTEEDRALAAALNTQLSTSRLVTTKIQAMVQEQVSLAKSADVRGSLLERGPANISMSDNNPARRDPDANR